MGGLRTECAGRIDSLVDLLRGDLPDADHGRGHATGTGSSPRRARSSSSARVPTGPTCASTSPPCSTAWAPPRREARAALPPARRRPPGSPRRSGGGRNGCSGASHRSQGSRSIGSVIALRHRDRHGAGLDPGPTSDDTGLRQRPARKEREVDRLSVGNDEALNTGEASDTVEATQGGQGSQTANASARLGRPHCRRPDPGTYRRSAPRAPQAIGETGSLPGLYFTK